MVNGVNAGSAVPALKARENSARNVSKHLDSLQGILTRAANIKVCPYAPASQSTSLNLTSGPQQSNERLMVDFQTGLCEVREAWDSFRVFMNDAMEEIEGALADVL